MGADSRFGRRATLPFPTPSGVLGLLCCALGRGGEQQEWLAHMKPYPQTVVAYASGHREVAPLLRDYQVVGNGYTSHDPWKDLMIPKKNAGKRPVRSGAKITHRFYIQDMAYVCALGLPDGEEETFRAGLPCPVWAICLGRKNCVPTEPFFRCIFSTEDEALAVSTRVAPEKIAGSVFRCLTECVEGARS